MIAFCRNPKLSRRAARLVTAAMAFIASAIVGHSQTPQVPYTQLENSTLTGSGNTITVSRIPVVISSGLTVYVNMTMQFNVDSNGNLTLSSGYPQVFAAPTLLSGSFKAGTYVGPAAILNGKTIVTVGGPGVSDGGATQWALNASSGSDVCTYPSSATWYVGPITNSPVGARLKNVGITSTAWSYGVAGAPSQSANCNNASFIARYWGPGTLIGVSQAGNTITIASFSDSFYNPARDYGAPVDQISFTLKP